jgi:hypothetical protein
MKARQDSALASDIQLVRAPTSNGLTRKAPYETAETTETR